MTRSLEPMQLIPETPAFASWLKSRPANVRRLADEFPIGTVCADPSGDDLYVIGWTEGNDVVLSPIWPGDDYDAAQANKVYAHASCLREPVANVRKP